MQIMLGFSTYIDIPANQLAAGHVEDYQAFDALEGFPPVVIYSGPSRPKDAYAATEYQGSWFWVDSHDYETKHSFAVTTHPYYTIND